ncbi:beta-ketoacyl synthase N-terminal-like domain-containing protein, partial [Actinosynnema sp. NPDC023658]|uniref:beta-ketoacyl synthase N-terminal-like domain-containing protein n=1 Tax=Actinosynnema sp. NPDC023658 TaxID=3155465 RepID=UPI00340C52F3
MTAEVMVTAQAVHLPGPGSPDDRLLALLAAEPAVGPDQAHVLLGRKGLLYKEPSTRLALCAVHRALGLPEGRPTLPLPGADRTAVIVSSNYGNVATVAEVVREERAGSGRDVSPLNSPNASSNVVASTIAIRWGFTGPNLTVCSGETSGLDAVGLGALALRAGRADRVVVVGVEPDDDTATSIAGPLRALAACVVLERAEPGRAGVLLGRVHRSEHVDDLLLDTAEIDDHVGPTSGARGVLQV